MTLREAAADGKEHLAKGGALCASCKLRPARVPRFRDAAPYEHFCQVCYLAHSLVFTSIDDARQSIRRETDPHVLATAMQMEAKRGNHMVGNWRNAPKKLSTDTPSPCYRVSFIKLCYGRLKALAKAGLLNGKEAA